MAQQKANYGRSTLPIPIRVALCNFISIHCKKNQETEYAEYEEGWDDEKILEEAYKNISNKINAGHVANHRKEMVGSLAPKHKLPPDPKLFIQLTETQTKLKDAETLIIRLLLRVDHIEKFMTSKIPGFAPLKEQSTPKAK
jgi:hypothetical protein